MLEVLPKPCNAKATDADREKARIAKEANSKRVKIREAVEMQAVLLADVKNLALDAGKRSACARAWDVLEDRIRELQGRPKLTTSKVLDKPKRSAPGLTRPAPSYSEPAKPRDPAADQP